MKTKQKQKTNTSGKETEINKIINDKQVKNNRKNFKIYWQAYTVCTHVNVFGYIANIIIKIVKKKQKQNYERKKETLHLGFRLIRKTWIRHSRVVKKAKADWLPL